MNVIKLVNLVILNVDVKVVKIQKIILKKKRILRKKKLNVLVKIHHAKKTIVIVINQGKDAVTNVNV